MLISPFVIDSKPASILKDDDFPQPEGPKIVINSPSLISKFKLLTASLIPSYDLVIL